MISKGNHANFARFVLLDVSEEAETWLPSFLVQCIIKQLLDSVFVISRIIKASVRVISLSLRLRLITPTSTLIILDITKTSSNNCLQFEPGIYWTKSDKKLSHFEFLMNKNLVPCNKLVALKKCQMSKFVKNECETSWTV